MTLRSANPPARRALVTGGSRGIGREVVRRLAASGADVALLYRSDARAARETVRLASMTGGGRVLAIRADVARESDVAAAVARVTREFGGIDILVNNAGVWPGGAIETISARRWDATFATNVRGTFLPIKHVISGMKRRRFGRIVNVSSTAGQRGEAFHSDYAATKGAIISLTKSLATEFAGTGITVNSVAPGWVDTDMSAAALGPRASRRKIERAIPTGRVATAADVAAAIVFLCSEEAGQIQGEILNVNGGSVLAG